MVSVRVAQRGRSAILRCDERETGASHCAERGDRIAWRFDGRQIVQRVSLVSDGTKKTGNEIPVSPVDRSPIWRKARGAMMLSISPSVPSMSVGVWGTALRLERDGLDGVRLMLARVGSMFQRESRTIASNSSGALGIPSDSTRQPSSVTSTSSSMRMPIPR